MEIENLLLRLSDKGVKFACRAQTDYSSVEDAQSPPLPQRTLSFQRGDYLHIKQVYSQDWWIGRVLTHGSLLGFLPSESKLKSVKQRQQLSTVEDPQKVSKNLVAVYEPAPIIRPIVFMGPSRKGSQLTDLLQKALVRFMKERFAGRLRVIKPMMSFEDMSSKQVSEVELQVWREGDSLQLLFLDCDASHPSQLEHTALHPLIVYIHISRVKVLEVLLKDLSVESRLKRREEEDAAHQLHDELQRKCLNPYSLVLSDSNFEDSCQTLELFLEHYWVATRSVSSNN